MRPTTSIAAAAEKSDAMNEREAPDRAAWLAFASELEAPLGNEETFGAALDAAERQHSDLVVDRVAFARWLAEKIRTSADLAVDLGRVHVADLFLVFAASAGAPGADEALDAVLRPVTARVHGSVSTNLSLDELHQELRIHFFVERDAKVARICEFRGLSSLARWLLVAATRTALNLVRDRPRERAFEDAFFLAQPDLRTPDVRCLLVVVKSRDIWT